MVVMFVIVVFVVYGTFRTIPTVESYGAGVYVPTVTGLSCYPVNVLLTSLYQIRCHRQQGMPFWPPLSPADEPEFD
jgi:hypothetical protein